MNISARSEMIEGSRCIKKMMYVSTKDIKRWLEDYKAQLNKMIYI